MMNYIQIFSVVAPLILLLINFCFNSFSSSRSLKINLPPSPPKLPIVGNLHQLGSYPHRVLHKLSKQYGPLMLIHLGSKPTLVVSSADAAREIMKTHDAIFSNRPIIHTANKLMYGSRDVAFAPYGNHWRHVRRILVLEMLSTKMVKSFRDVREEETSLMIKRIRSSSTTSRVNMSVVLKDLTNDIICRIVLGRKYGDREDGKRVKETMSVLVELIREFSLSDYIPWLGWLDSFNGLNSRCEKTARDIDRFLEQVIEEHIHDEGDEARGLDFVDVLLQVQKDNSSAGFTVERDTLKALILNMFAAGTDTTLALMVWAMAELLRHPNIMKKLQAEIRQVAAGKPEIDEDDLEKLDYLKAVLKETLRLHSPVPILVPRESTKATNIEGYDIPAGTQVLVNTWAIGRDPGLWEKPEDFIPERFRDNDDLDFWGPNNFQMIPFGAGRRVCPGRTFAMAVDELTLAKLLFNFDFEVEELDMTETPGVSVNKKSPLLAVATPYHPRLVL